MAAGKSSISVHDVRGFSQLESSTLTGIFEQNMFVDTGGYAIEFIAGHVIYIYIHIYIYDNH